MPLRRSGGAYLFDASTSPIHMSNDPAVDLDRLVERVVATVDAQASPKQPDSVPQHVITRAISWDRRDGAGHITEAIVSPDDVERAIERALDGGRIEVEDEEAVVTRYTLSD